VKPYDGSLSVGARALLSPGMVSPDVLADETLLFMEWLNPKEYDEFTIDLTMIGGCTQVPRAAQAGRSEGPVRSAKVWR